MKIKVNIVLIIACMLVVMLESCSSTKEVSYGLSRDRVYQKVSKFIDSLRTNTNVDSIIVLGQLCQGCAPGYPFDYHVFWSVENKINIKGFNKHDVHKKRTNDDNPFNLLNNISINLSREQFYVEDEWNHYHYTKVEVYSSNKNSVSYEIVVSQRYQSRNYNKPEVIFVLLLKKSVLYYKMLN